MLAWSYSSELGIRGAPGQKVVIIQQTCLRTVVAEAVTFGMFGSNKCVVTMVEVREPCG